MSECRVCGDIAGGPEYRIPEVMFGTGEFFRYFQCRSCGCLQIASIPDDLSRYYSGSYYSFAPPRTRKRSIRRKLVDRWAYERRGGPIARFLYSRHPNDELRRFRELNIGHGDPVLDVGCGNGQRVLDLIRTGFTRVQGIDAFLPENVVIGGRVIAYRKTLDAVADRFTVIMFHHVLEHVPDQHRMLSAARDRLLPGGALVVRVPTVSSFAWGHYREHWVQLDAPRHLYLHSTDSLRVLAAANGLSLRSIEYDSTEFQFWGSDLAARGVPLERPGAARWDSDVSARKRALLRRRARQLNAQGRGDQFVAILTRS